MNLSAFSPLVVATLAIGCGTPPHDTPAAAPAVPLASVAVRSADVPSTFEAGGIVRSRSTASIASRILAPVLDVHVRAGDRVRRGAPLVTLDGREMAANRARGAAALMASTEGEHAARGVVRSAEASVTLARATHARIRTLHDKRSATAQELDQAVSSVGTAEAQLASARASLAAAGAGREAAHAANDATAIAASYSVLTAPFDGIVTERSIDPGAMAAPGMPLLTLEDPATLRLDVAMDEARASQVSSGQRAEIRIGDDPAAGVWVPSTVSEVARIDSSSHSFVVKLDLPTGSTVRSGAFGRARFTGAPRRTLTVPASAAVRRGQLTFVFVLDDDDRARLQPISPGVTVGDQLEVLAGVRERDRVVAAPPPSLADGAQVTGERQ